MEKSSRGALAVEDLRNLSQKVPEIVTKAAAYVETKVSTIKDWLDGKNIPEGRTLIFLESFIRGVNNTSLRADPETDLMIVLEKGLGEKLFPVEDVAKATGTKKIGSIFDWIWGKARPNGLRLVRLEWFLHNIRKKGKPFWQSPRLVSAEPEIIALIKELSAKEPDEILPLLYDGAEVNSAEQSLLSWVTGRNQPTKSMKIKIASLFIEGSNDVPKSAAEVQAVEVEPVAESPIAELPTDQIAPYPNLKAAGIDTGQILAGLDMIVGALIPDPVAKNPKPLTDALREVKERLEDIFRSIPSNQEEVTLETLRKEDPELYFDLSNLLSVISDPEGRKSRDELFRRLRRRK